MVCRMIDKKDADLGKEATVIWGKPNGGSKKPSVEPLFQKEIRATIQRQALFQAGAVGPSLLTAQGKSPVEATKCLCSDDREVNGHLPPKV